MLNRLLIPFSLHDIAASPISTFSTAAATVSPLGPGKEAANFEGTFASMMNNVAVVIL